MNDESMSGIEEIIDTEAPPENMVPADGGEHSPVITPGPAQPPVPGRGRPRKLSEAEKFDCWNQYAAGVDPFTLADKYGTKAPSIISAINYVASLKGWPHNWLDPEMERLRLIDSAYLMKAELTVRIVESRQILNSTALAMEALLNGRQITDLDDVELKRYNDLASLRRNEVLAFTKVSQEYRGFNVTIADLAGVRKSAPKRKEKQVGAGRVDGALDSLSSEALERIIEHATDAKAEEDTRGNE